MKIVLFFSMVPLWVLYLPKINIAALCWGRTILCWSELFRDCNRRNKIGDPCHPLHLFESALYSWFTVLLQPWSFFRSRIHQSWTAVHFFGFVSTQKNIMIRMKAIHQNSLSIKYCSPLSHSEILVKQTLYDTFVYHQLEFSSHDDENNTSLCHLLFCQICKPLQKLHSVLVLREL